MILVAPLDSAYNDATTVAYLTEKLTMTAAGLQKLSEHFYWLPPDKPDRPSLGLVVGERECLLLDAGASPAHSQYLLEQVDALDLPRPRLLALSHWHWDHVFGAAYLGLPIIAQQQTAAELARLASYDWSDEAIDARLALGLEAEMCARDIKLELPAPRQVEIALPQILFEQRLSIDLGGVRCQLEHVGGDHAADSVVAYLEPDGILFLGDCLYDAIYMPVRHYSSAKLVPLLEKVLAYPAQHFIEGHTDSVMPRQEVETMAAQMRYAAALVERLGNDPEAVFAAASEEGHNDEDSSYFLKALLAGLGLA